ncbi:MAG: SusD/RagB family nutrient-binding outer membrane lipoprotein [Bacteroidaceae bacterium]|nr:SusD/RagB family nutrient-binding outer membrane lipoprotein [Bacteroidaceae bacterium]
MNKKHILLAGALFFASTAMQSCLDYDDPGDEANLNTIQTETTVHVGNVDSIPYWNEPIQENVQAAIDTLQGKYKYFGQCLSGIYMMRGGKEGQMPGDHAYQRQYSLGPDLYAQYFTVPHKDFMYGTLTSTYNVSAEFNGGPLGAYTMAKNAFMPMLNHPLIDTLPEIKAIGLLYYCLIAQEQADLSGPYTYLEDKKNSQEPEEYNDVRTIYYGIVENIDTIVACLNHFETRPDWYKEQIQGIIAESFTTGYNLLAGDMSLNSYIKFANSLKLRMAIHIAKVEPETAKKWAEEAVAGGVIEGVYDQHGVFPMINSFTHPIANIANGWGDLRMCASFESLLISLDHPYAKYLFLPNSNDIPNEKAGTTLPAGSRICGIRAGTLVGDGQTYALNKRQAYSTISTEVLASKRCPIYFIKWAEVDFLRAEGVLRGWNMGGTAEEFYNRGIQNAYIEDPLSGSQYTGYVNAYKQREEPVEYIQEDPMGDGEPWPSVTKIGVKWNENDDNETKLEKIITQKYIALFPLSTEAWTEMRRTGYPKMFAVLNADDGDGSIEQGDIIRRIPWVPTDPVAASMVEASGVPALGGPDEQATRLWWDVDAPNI